MADEKCTACLYHSEFDNRIKRAEEQIKDILGDIADIKDTGGRNDEQIKMIFKILNEIKDSIVTIGDEMKNITQKPAQKWDDLTKSIMAAAVGGAVGFLISKLK